MNSHLKSVGKKFRVVLGLGSTLAFTLVLIACVSAPSEEDTSPEAIQEELSSEVSIKADREYLDKERQNIPEEIKKANDELAFDLEQMGTIKDDPNKIRSRFQTKVRKIRDKFRKQTRREREKFSKAERKSREAFLKALKKERDEFKKEKPDREKSREFYAEQDVRRKEYFADAKDKRREYESESRSQSKEFSENLRERVNQFNDQLRIYTKRYRYQKKCERDGTCEGANNTTSSREAATSRPASKKTKTYDLREFEEMKKVPGVRLTPQATDK